MFEHFAMFARSIGSVVVATGWVSLASAASPLQYNRDVRPILAENCFACHGMDSESRAAGLRLDLREEAIDYGAFEPGLADESELVARLYEEDLDLLMPPPESHKSLTEEQKQILIRWINEGAHYEKHWAFIAPTAVAPPKLGNSDSIHSRLEPEPNWIKNPIDAFVLNRLHDAGLRPAAPERPSRLIRRLALDVTGLPPTADQVAEFVTEYQVDPDAAVNSAVDRMMQTPAWGEHRARYWLDAARYADTHGMHRDNYREIWPYRDWVIRSFNGNQPFAQFAVEQLAGDLLPDATLDQKVATGFQRCTMTTNEGGTIDEENLATYAADRVQTYGWVFMGLTTNCCQCHDHKFDPLSAKDYYALSAYFRNSSQSGKDNDNKFGGGAYITVPAPEDRELYERSTREAKRLEADLKLVRENKRPDFEHWAATATPDSVVKAEQSVQPMIYLPLSEPVTLAGLETNRVTLVSNSSKGTLNVDTDDATRDAGKLKWKDDEKFGRAVELTSESQIRINEAGDFSADDAFSHACWFRTPTPNQAAGIVARMDTKDSHRGWDLFLANGTLAMHLLENWPENALKVTTTDRIVKKNQWHHVAVTYDGSRTPEGIQIYLDGELQKTRVEKNNLTKDANVRTSTPLRLGQRSDADLLNAGSIREFCLFDRSLNQREVSQLASVFPVAVALGKPTEERSPSDERLIENFYYDNIDPDYSRVAVSLAESQAEVAAIERRSPICMIQDERDDQPAKTNLLIRGEYDSLGEEVMAAPPAALHPLPDDAPANRLGLAMWTVAPENPLFARVTVNRFWQEVFGRGIVETTEDFGVMGTPPSHPELLDFLAVDFMENGTDVKRLFKQMLTSSTYRQSARVTPEKLEKDRDNVLLSRGPRFRLDGEVLRDSALASSGLLSETMYGPGTYPYQPENLWDVVGLPGSNTRNYRRDEGENLFRRSVYTFWKRMSPPPGMEAFDAPTREVCTVRRERTNTPLQALVVLNSTQYVEAARNLAGQAIAAVGVQANALSPATARETINAIALPVLSRPLSEAEMEVLLSNAADFLAHFESNLDDARALLSVGTSPIDADVPPSDLAAWTMVANQILNLDEALTK